jgi:mono/diheme cytochrome c family protein
MAVAVRVPLEKLADPTDTSYIPRPEWYFLFLFQTLKLMSGPLEIVGTIILPTLAIAMLFAIPFIDRGPMRRLRHRTLAIGVVALAAIGWTALTATAIATTPKMEEIDVTAEGEQGAPAWQQLSSEELSGLGYFRKENCKACHLSEGKKGIGPNLAGMPAAHRTPAWMVPHFKNPSAVVPGSTMPPVQLNDAQLHALTAFVVKLTPQNEQTLLNVPDFAVQGAMIYEKNHCNACHQINGAGTKLGPPLNGVSKRRDRAWLERHFRDPQGVSPSTVMPAYKFSDKEMDDICQYLLSL